MKIVLITSGLDELSKLFDTLPGEPVAVIELDEWDTKQKIKYAIRRCLRMLAPNKYADLQSWSKHVDLEYFSVARTQKQRIQEILESMDADLVITYRCPLIPVALLQGLSHGAINVHDSVLPYYRGGDPLFWQVLHGVDFTGVTVHRLTDELDKGPIVRQAKFRRPKYRSEKDISFYVNVIHGYHVLYDAVQDILNGVDVAMPQKHDESDDLPRAPNYSRENWRKLVEGSSLDSTRIRDIECFLEEST